MAPGFAENMMTNLLPSLGPALMISMGYIDLGKWVAVVEGGARFGFDLLFLVLLFNCTAIFCQYLSVCIGTVTGKNLAEICSEEYCRAACLLLGVQAELSMIISDVTTILGMGHGLSLLFGTDLFVGILCATIGVILLPSFLNLLDNYKSEALFVCVAGFALLFYVLGVLISQPEVPLVMDGIFPKLIGESAYSIMALLGANIMAHNFYIHPSIIKEKKQPNVAMGTVFHDHLFAILVAFTGIFLVYYVLMNSAAALSGSMDVVFNSQDVYVLMDQIFRSPIAPLAFFMVLFFSSQITAFNRDVGRQVILRGFFGINQSWVHQALVKALAILPALYCAKAAGAEGIYQLLIFCQVVLAMLLPSSVIPLFRVASSRFLMSAFKISWYLETFALVAFLVMFASNIFFVIDMLLGNNSWMINLMGSTDSTVMIPYTFLLIVACASIGLTLHLAVTPLKSASENPETQIWADTLHQDRSELSEGVKDDNLDLITYDEHEELSVEDVLEKSVESQSEKSLVEFSSSLLEATGVDSDQDSHLSTNSSSVTASSLPLLYQPQESKSAAEIEWLGTAEKASTGCLSDVGVDEKIDSKEPSLKDEELGMSIHMEKDNNEVVRIVEAVDTFEGFPLSSTSDGPGSFNNLKTKGFDGSNGSGSLSRLSGLGRAARRQLATVLDEFWGNLFDFHGKLTQEAANNRLDVLLGLNLRTVGSTIKSDAIGIETSKSFIPNTDAGSVFPTNARGYNSPRQMKTNGVDLTFGVQMGSSPWSQNMQSLDSRVQSSSGNMLDPSGRHFPNLHQLQYSDSKDYQPATIHGYQIPSYLREIGATRNPYSSSISTNLPPTPTSTSTLPMLRDTVLYSRAQNELGNLSTSGLQNPALSQMSRLLSETPYYESSFSEIAENVGSAAYPKKYHSSPDISAIIALGRNSYLNEMKQGAPIGPRPPSSSRMVSDQSQYMKNVSRPGVPLAFDQLSPPKLQRDVFGLNPDTRSLFSRQPYEQLFGKTGKGPIGTDVGTLERPNAPSKETFTYAESGAKLLQSLRFCIGKLLKLEGSDWLFKQIGGSDEDLIDQVVASEKYLHRMGNAEMNLAPTGVNLFNKSEEADYFHSIPNCGDDCVWQAAIVVSFGVWCIRRILELSLVESRPELWGKYTYVLNRLQGIIEPAFFKPRHPVVACRCLEIPREDSRGFSSSLQPGSLRSADRLRIKPFTTASMILETIKDVETAVNGRKGRTGTAAGDVAFPKGKENLASVLKRYKRRLSNKPPASAHEGASTPRKIASPAPPSVF